MLSIAKRVAALAVVLLVAGSVVPAGAALIAGPVDTFEDGGCLLGRRARTTPNAPLNISTGGPAGAGDDGLPNGLTVHGFGEDAFGEHYALVTNTPANGTGGIVYKFGAVPEPGGFAPLLFAAAALAAGPARRRRARSPR